MAESSWPTVAGSRIVTDDQWELMASGWATDGVIATPSDTAVVFGDASGRQVKIRANKYAVVSGHGWASGSTEVTKSISANSSGSTRIDRVVLGLDRTTWAVTCYVKNGTAGSGVPPSLQQDARGSSAGKYEISLATVTVINGASTISATDVAAAAPLTRVGWNSAWGVVSRGRRTTNSTTTASGETGVLRVSSPVLAGRLYRISTNCLINGSTSTDDTVTARLRYTTDGSTPSTSSTILASGNISVPPYVPQTVVVIGYFPAATNHTLTVLLTVLRPGGVGTGQLTVSSDNPSMDLIIEDVGPDPTDTGVDI